MRLRSSETRGNITESTVDSNYSLPRLGHKREKINSLIRFPQSQSTPTYLPALVALNLLPATGSPFPRLGCRCPLQKKPQDAFRFLLLSLLSIYHRFYKG